MSVALHRECLAASPSQFATTGKWELSAVEPFAQAPITLAALLRLELAFWPANGQANNKSRVNLVIETALVINANKIGVLSLWRRYQG
jgi:hypothetical protein